MPFSDFAPEVAEKLLYNATELENVDLDVNITNNEDFFDIEGNIHIPRRNIISFFKMESDRAVRLPAPAHPPTSYS